MPAKRKSPAKNYSEYISLLRERDVIPSFEETRALLLAAPVIDKGYLTRKFTLFSLIALFFFASPLTPETIQQRSPLHSRNIAAIGGPVQKTISNDRAIAGCKQISLGLNRSNRTYSPLNSQTTQTHPGVTTRIFPVKVRTEDALVVTASKMTAAFLSGDESIPNYPRYDISLGNIMTMANGVSKTQILNPSVEFHLNLDSHSSLALEVSSPGINHKSPANLISFHDTTFRVSDQVTHNVIGQASTVTLSNASKTLVLLAGYRYQMPLPGTINPFAEVLIGTNFASVVTSEKLGVRIAAPGNALPFSFDISLRTNQLLEQHSSFGANFGLEMAIAYVW